MPHRIAPPCGYIREVCYNDCAPAPKVPRRRNKAAKLAPALPPSPQTPAARQPEPGGSDLLFRLLLAYYLS